METLNLHSLILEELSEVLALSYASAEPAAAETSADEEVDSDPAVWRILAQCPALPDNDSGNDSSSDARRQTVTQRQLNGILALAKLVSHSAPSSAQRLALLPRVLAYADAAAHYRGPGGAAAHGFARQLTSRLLQCAASGSAADGRAVMACVWRRMHALVRQTDPADTAALAGMVAALERTHYRFTAEDVLQADELLEHGKTAAAAATAVQALVVVRAVLESRLGERLVAAGALDGASARESDPQQLWDAVARLGQPCAPLPAGAAGETQACEHVLVASLQMLDQGASEHAMRLGLYAAALGCMLLGRAEPRLLDAVAAHLRGAQAYGLAGATQVCLRVLAALAAFFGDATRAAATGLATAFVTAPPACLVDALPDSGGAASAERALLDPAADVLVAALRPAARAHVLSCAHALFGALATAGGAQSRRAVRVARSVAVVLARMAAACADAGLTALVVGMLCAPRFAAPELLALALQCAADVAPSADRQVFGDVAAATLKHVRFGDRATSAATQAAARALERLAAGVAGRGDAAAAAAADALLAMVLRAFVDASVESHVHARRRSAAAAAAAAAATPLAVYLPVLRALVGHAAAAGPAGGSAETVELWRAFWLHVVARGHVTEPAHAAAFAALAARAPLLVHASSVNYLETELAAISVVQRDVAGDDAAAARLRAALLPLLPPAVHPLARTLGAAQTAFLLAVHATETMRAAGGGGCAAMLGYFANAAVASSALLPAVEAIADRVVAAYVRATTTRRVAVDHAAGAGRVAQHVRELLVLACHHLQLVSRWAQRAADALLRAFPQALLDAGVVATLLELVQLVWKGWRAAQDDQFVPVYWFTSRTLGITLQLPDSVSYRQALLAQVSGAARRWLLLAGRSAPMELETLLQAYLALPSMDDLNCEPHVGHALALDVGNALRYGLGSAAGLAADGREPNASSFAFRRGQRDYLRGLVGRGTDVAALKRDLAAVYHAAAAAAAAAPPPGDSDAEPACGPLGDVRAVVERLQHATHYVVAAAAVDRELVRLVVWVPLAMFDERVVRAAAHMWTQLLVERPASEELLMVELTVAWTWLAQQHRGLFSQRFEPRTPFAARMSYAPSDKRARGRAYAQISRALAPHALLIEFLARRFDSVKHRAECNFSVVNATLRILQATFDAAARLTTNALARGPLFMLVNLGFGLLNLGFDHSPVLESQLRRALYQVAFAWFALPPRWSFSGSRASVASEIRVLVDTRRAVLRDAEDSEAAAGAGSILGVARDQLRQRARRSQSLLLLLLENEIGRMATWANPTGPVAGESDAQDPSSSSSSAGFPDVARFVRSPEMSDAGWARLVQDAWAADPRLSVQLLARFAHPAVRRELAHLVARFPGELVGDPDALPLLVDRLHVHAAGSPAGSPAATLAPGSAGHSSSHPPALAQPPAFRELKFLIYWAPVPPITSAAYLASPPVSSNPLALQYAMRALESFPVDVTFFYIPQLVQALRHDASGYVERAILSSAQISQHFAHQIIWNMKANMFKDEESLQPDALKPALDRIVDRILLALSGEDREYYEKEFGFFNEVTGISGKLKPFIKKSKAEKKRKIDEEMRKVTVQPGVYLPSNPDGTVVDIDYDSGRPLQSHAKAPFMATFVISRPAQAADEVQELLKQSERTVTPADAPEEPPRGNSLPPMSTRPMGQLPVIEESRPLSAQISIHVDQGDAAENVRSESPSSQDPVQPHIDTEYLSAQLTRTKIAIHRTSSSAISDAPDLIGIAGQQQQQQQSQQSQQQLGSGRRSREYSVAARSYSVSQPASAAVAVQPLEKPAAATDDEAAEQPAASASSPSPPPHVIARLSAIFKVGDDCRQDVLALQLIAVFKNIFTSCGLDLYLYPYRVVATAPGCGVIDVIPNSLSRDQMGREKVNSLSDYFATRYHGVDSIQYQQARTNFVQSLAAYSVLSYLLQFKDRHNGNIMVDDQGHIVHIDFGFILDIAPGGITFESAPFKLTHEYVMVMGGSEEAQPYRLFCELCVKAYLACRPYAERIVQIVALMLESGLPCFKGETTLTKLRARFQLDRSEHDAAQFMVDRIKDSYENRRTVLYDQFQKATNGIPY
ncbi:phosphatidylinositol-4- kinase [Coemansia erecta]|uniref:1-phosphatidylinositol 4-kinase n=1 Tax=Coemansia erecta TaxID=147472 RepID=A0A9W8CQH0_9FUNG|nr:phosphatidylinositol-4- kinase [Coemansia erecta]